MIFTAQIFTKLTTSIYTEIYWNLSRNIESTFSDAITRLSKNLSVTKVIFRKTLGKHTEFYENTAGCLATGNRSRTDVLFTQVLFLTAQRMPK